MLTLERPRLFSPFWAPAVAAAVFLKLMFFHGALEAGQVRIGLADYVGGALRGILSFDLAPLFSGMYGVNAGAALIAVGWASLVRERHRATALLAANAAISALIVLDLARFAVRGELVSTQALTLDGGLAWPSLRKLLLFGDLPLWAVLFKKLESPAVGRSDLRAFPVWLVVGLVVYGAIVGRRLWNQPSVIRNPYGTAYLYEAVGLFGYHAVRLGDHARHLALRQLGEPALPPLPCAPGGATAPAVFPRANLILVQLESYPQWVFDYELDGRPVAPNLRALAQSSLRFPNLFHVTGDGGTSDAEYAALCSLYPPEDGGAYLHFPNNTRRCLPAVLKAQGYSTAAFHPNDAAFWGRQHAYPALGFDRFDARPSYAPGEIVVGALGDRPFLAQVAQRLEAMPRPFASFVITMSSHEGFHVPRALRVLGTPHDESKFARFLESVHYADRAVGDFVAELERRGLWDTSIVAFYGDHDPPAFEQGDTWGVRPADNRKPFFRHRTGMFVHLPGDAAAGVDPALLDQVDISPTLAPLLGISAPDAGWMGRSAFARAPRALALAKDIGVVGQVFATSKECQDVYTGAPADPAACAEARRLAANQRELSERAHRYDLALQLAYPKCALAANQAAPP